MPPSCSSRKELTILVQDKEGNKRLSGISVRIDGKEKKTNDKGMVQVTPKAGGSIRIETDKYDGEKTASFFMDKLPQSILFNLTPREASLVVSVKGVSETSYEVHLRRNGAGSEEIGKQTGLGDSMGVRKHGFKVAHGEYTVWLDIDKREQHRYIMPSNVTVLLDPGDRKEVELKLEPRKCTTIEIELVDSEDKPIPEEAYEVHLYNSTDNKFETLKGNLDKNGQAHVKIDKEVHEKSFITFPGYDKADIIPTGEQPAQPEPDPPKKELGPKFGAAEVCFVDKNTFQTTPCNHNRNIPFTSNVFVKSPPELLPAIYYRLQRPEFIKAASIQVMKKRNDFVNKVRVWGRNLSAEEIQNGEGLLDWSWDDGDWTEKAGDAEKKYVDLLGMGSDMLHLLLQVGDNPAQQAWSFIYVEPRSCGLTSVSIFGRNPDDAQIFYPDRRENTGECRPGIPLNIAYTLLGHQHIDKLTLLIRAKDSTELYKKEITKPDADDGKCVWDGMRPGAGPVMEHHFPLSLVAQISEKQNIGATVIYNSVSVTIKVDYTKKKDGR
jgi:hypothetical protein